MIIIKTIIARRLNEIMILGKLVAMVIDAVNQMKWWLLHMQEEPMKMSSKQTIK